jgi:hypothetical protein
MKKILSRNIFMIILTLCRRLLTLVTMESRKTQMLSIQKRENADQETFFKARILPGAGHLPKLLELAERT